MRATAMFYERTLRQPRTLFAIGLVALCLTLVLSYERIKSSTISLFSDTPPGLDTSSPLSRQELQAYRYIFAELAPMSYGTAHRPPLKAMPPQLVADLPAKYVPSLDDDSNDDVSDDDSHKRAKKSGKRLIIVGDVHGQKSALEDLLSKLDFNTDHGDHLILTGDLVNKGPDSAGVVALAMKHNAHAVRGNHEDRVLLAHAKLARKHKTMSDDADDANTEIAAAALAQFHIKQGTEDDETAPRDPQEAMDQYHALEEATLSKGDKRDRETARALSREQIEWLANLPVILRIGAIPAGGVKGKGKHKKNKGNPTLFENMLVCHAGLVPNVSLADQDPWAVMNMRTLVYPANDARRDAVRKHLKDRAKERLRKSGGRGTVAAEQSVDEAMVDAELAKVLRAQGLVDRLSDVALPSSGREGTHWYEVWSEVQERLVKENKKKEKKNEKDLVPATTVVYGHDAKSGLKVPKEAGKGKKGYTFGLDSGCVYGKSLTALVIEVKHGEAVYEIVQVDCDKGTDVKEE